MDEERIHSTCGCAPSSHRRVRRSASTRGDHLDIPLSLSLMPMLAVGHRDYERRMVDRLKISHYNSRNHLKRSRRRILWEAWDELFQVIRACTKRHAPLLHTMMWESCNLRAMGVLGGHFDGPLVWRILLSRINTEDPNGRRRTRSTTTSATFFAVRAVHTRSPFSLSSPC